MRRSRQFLNYRLVGWWPVITIFSAIVGWPLSLVFGILWPAEFAFAYLTILSFFFTLAAGALFWVLLHHAVDAAWSVTIRRIWEHLACLLMPISVLGLPLVFLNKYLWLPEAHLHSLFSPGIQLLLVGLAFVVLAGFAWFLRRISKRDDQKGGEAKMMRRVAFAAAPCYAVCFCLISILAWMTLQGGWISAIWPIYLFAGSALASLALTVFLVDWIRPAFGDSITSAHFRLFGKLLFAFTVFWGYVALSQYLIIWYGNLPNETAFFRIRSQGLAHWGGWVLFIGHFLIPFLLLLPHAAKNWPRFLAGVAVWLVLMHLVELCWLLLPPLGGSVVKLSFLLLICFASIGGTLAIIFLKWLGYSPLWPVSDHRLAECLSLRDE